MSALEKPNLPEPPPTLAPLVNTGPVDGPLPPAANDDGADVPPLAKKESLFKRGLRGIFQMAATGGATMLVKGVATSVLMGSSVPALAIMAGSVAATSITGSLITTYFYQRREHRETGANTKSFRQVFARKLMISAAISTATLGMVHNWASISSFCGPAFNAAARFAQPVLEHSTVQNVMNALGNVAQKTTHALAQYSPLRFAHADDTGSIGYGPRALEQPTYGSGPAETVSGPGKLEMYVPAASTPPAAPELPKLELVSPTEIHGGAVPVAPEGIAVHAPPIARMDVQSQVQELLDSGHLDRKTAQAAKALLKNPENGQRLKDFAHFLLNKEHNPQKALEFYHLAAEAGNKQAIADLAYLESKGIGLPAQPAPPVTNIADSGSPQPGFGHAGEARAEFAHAGEPLGATQKAPPVGRIAAECHMRGIGVPYNGPVVVENVNCTVHEATMKPGDSAIVTGPYGMKEQFKWGGDHTIPTGEFFFGAEQVTPGGLGESRAGWGVGRIAQSLASAFRGSADYVRDLSGKFTFQPFANTFTPAFQ